ncbi:MAG: salicylate 1-monooxygenase [Betaproteobacteria bacterium]|nr:salicylate 1-monooxygenase [Betaproteobacteria bacterium]
MSSRPLSIAVIGAGIGGLAAATLLGRSGHRVRVYEQAGRFARVGAGIQMTPNAMKVLRGLGLEARLREVAFQSPSGVSREWDTAAITNELRMGEEIETRFGAPYLFLHRADLHAAIQSAVPADCVELNRKLARLEQNAQRVTLYFKDGTHEEADAVIAADGVHSTVRELMLGPEQPRFTGRVAYRTTFPAALMGSERITPVRTKWWGPDRHMVVYYVTRNLDEVYFVTSQPEKVEWMTPESWSAKGNLEELRAAYAGFHPEVQAVLRACPDVHKWALLERDPLPRWTEERVALLGDACHPMTPYMAQGAASALEDSVILSRCLAGVDAGGVAAALRVYEATRKPRTSEIQGSSRKNTWMRTDTDPTWVYGYDAWTTPLASTA